MTMEKQTPQIVNLERDGNQEEHLVRISSARAAAAQIETPLPRQLPTEPNPDDPSPPEPELDIFITSPAPNATISVPASPGTFTAHGSVAAIGYIVSKIEVKFGSSGFFKLASGKTSWTCTSGQITTSGPLTITARVTAKRSVGSFPSITVEDTSNVTIVLTDNVPPVVTITQPAANRAPAKETNGIFTVALQGTATDNMSGIKRVEYSLDGMSYTTIVAPSPLPSTVNWSANVTVPLSAKEQTIFVRAVDGNNNVPTWPSQRTVVTDKTAPTLQIQVPERSQLTLPDTVNGGATLPRLAGTAADNLSGVQKVEWALDPAPTNPQLKLAVPKAANDWSSWSVENIAIPGPAGALHTIKVRCVDFAGNVSPEKVINVAVAPKYPPKDPTVQEYFSSLIEFIVRRVQVTAQNRLLQVEDLTAEFHQPFQRLLSADATLSNQQVHQIRICIEVLRQYLAKHGPLSAVAQQGLQQAEAEYRLAAYETLLKRIGTSFAEIRAARLADEPARQALAQRLGFDLPPPEPETGPSPTSLLPAAAIPQSPPPIPEPPAPGPDRLQQLLLQPGQFTEADLEAIFGLVDTTRDPLQPPSFHPKLLDWQLQFLTAGWAKQDDAAAVSVIDPDLIREADLQPLTAAYSLWQSRATWVNTHLHALRQQRETQANLLTGFDQVVSGILGPIADLLALDAQRVAGADIEPPLAQQQITLAAFVHLMGLRQLAEAGTILASEWDDVYSILTQVQKRRSFAAWRAEERLWEVVLGPDWFRIPAPGQTIIPPAVSPEWRVTVQARQLWQDTLKARINQQVALKQALLSVVDATEEDTLPLLRDALVTAIGTLQTPPDDADSLSQKLQIDIQTSGYQKITRISQAIQTLQDILIDLQTGSLTVGWARDEKNGLEAYFDEELRWIGSYSIWQAAMQVFLYPENYLLPTLRRKSDTPPGQVPEIEEQTPAFQQLLSELRKSSELTPEEAQTRAQNYLDALKNDYAPTSRNIPFPPLLFADLPSVPPKPFRITEQYTQSELLLLAQRTKALTFDADLGEIPAYIREIFYFVPIALALQLQKSGQYLTALDWFRAVYAYDLPSDKRKIYHGLVKEHDFTLDPSPTYQRNIFWLAEPLNPHTFAGTRNDAYTRFVVMSLVRCLLEFADAEFTQDTNESLPRARSLYMQALDLLDIPEMQPPVVPGLSPNPVIASLKFHAQVNLAKIHSGRNIAGLKRQLELVPQAGQAPAARPLHPTPYRYSVLIDRAKQLVTIAQQVEAAYLSALEKRDNEAYSLFKANQDLGLAQANVHLQDLRVSEAADSLILAERQRQRAAFQVDTYQGFLDADMTKWEEALLEDYKVAAGAQIAANTLGGAVTAAQAMTTAASGGIFGSGASAGLGAAIAVGALVGLQTVAANIVTVAEANIQAHSLYNSIEQRRQEWNFQLGLAKQDVAISDQQVQLAKDHQNIVGQERSIAQMQQSDAQATVEFLARKFTNAELYEWMSGILSQVYRYFLQQASAMAQLAQHQLAFERQEVPPTFVQNDYWQPPVDGSGPASDRRGLTGSTRLLQDIYQLDQFAFGTNKRKLQLTKTISLARLAPLEFQRFRETGVLTFATPMQLFDSDFPGHYLRLIKRVRTSVVALIPPNQGIRATLTTSGVSRVVIGGDAFQTISVRRDPESVALTSPMNATGLFELEAQSDLLLPFEFMGVDTMWNLEMPKAANPFDYITIADVLLTIEYTALSSQDYRQQVIQQLDGKFSADRPYSFRHQFADQWYDLNNPEQTATPMVVSFSTTREDFPPNVENFTIQQVALYFILTDGTTVEDFRAQLHFTEQGSPTPLGSEATSTPKGIISTRLGNAAGWAPMIGQSPFGQWELALPNTAATRNLFASEAIEDILFVITYNGRTPAWPAA
jgi:Tc toxin complex TcA C-terminal TcB-binding domain/Bacterial Ig domain